MSENNPTSASHLRDTKADAKNIYLAKLIYQFRQATDLYRLIGLNVEKLKEHGASDAFWGFTQMLAHENMSITACKIYEWEDQYERNSIPGVINSIEATTPTYEQKREIQKFVDSWASGFLWATPKEALAGTMERFRKEMEPALFQLRYYRNKVGAHSEPGIKIEELPSLGEYERLHDFARDFYEVVSKSLIVVQPALLGAQIEVGALRVFEKLGIENPARTYPETTER
jgi:hypothetical protein